MRRRTVHWQMFRNYISFTKQIISSLHNMNDFNLTKFLLTNYKATNILFYNKYR